MNTETHLDVHEMKAPLHIAEASSSEQEEREATDWQWLMGQATGRRILWRLLSRAGIYRNTFSQDPYIAAFNEGRRNAGLQLLSDIERYCHEDYLLMMKENHNG